MNNRVIRFIIVIIITLVISSINYIHVNNSILSILYHVSCIVFSIGMLSIISFSLNGVRARGYINSIRKNLANARSSFIIEFSFVTGFYTFYTYIPNLVINYIRLDWSWFVAVFTVFSICFFVKNFIAIQDLKDDIFERTFNSYWNNHKYDSDY